MAVETASEVGASEVGIAAEMNLSGEGKFVAVATAGDALSRKFAGVTDTAADAAADTAADTAAERAGAVAPLVGTARVDDTVNLLGASCAIAGLMASVTSENESSEGPCGPEDSRAITKFSASRALKE